MVIEEKAKAYDMALEAARKELGVDRKEWGVVQRVLHNIFPELRESEDERIRKELIIFLRSPFIKENLTDEKVAPWLEWLEKQKEQKVDIDKLRKDIYQSGYNDGYQHGKEDAQKEQPSPAEWSEEDADILNCCISSIEEAKENRYAYKETDGDTSYDREIAWLKSLRPSWKPNDNQMSMLRAIVNDPNNVGAESCHLAMQSLYNDLLKLK